MAEVYIYVIYLLNQLVMEKKRKRIKIFKTFEELDADQLRLSIESSPEERWETFWKMKGLFSELSPRSAESDTENMAPKKRVIIFKPTWI